MMARLLDDSVPGEGPDTSRSDQLRADVMNVVASVANHINEPLAGLESDVRALCSQTQAALVGQADILADSVRQSCDKIIGRLEDGERRIAGEMYHYWQQAGLPLPGRDSVPYYLATGDAYAAVVNPTPAVGVDDAGGQEAAIPLPTPAGGGIAPNPSIPTPLPGGQPSVGPVASPVPQPPAVVPGDVERGTPITFGYSSQQTEAFTPAPTVPQCPPGYMPAGGSVDSQTNYATLIGGSGQDVTRGPGVPTAGPYTNGNCASICPRPITGGWEFAYPYGSAPVPLSSPYIHPWVQETPPHAGLTTHHEWINGACFTPIRPEPVRLNVPDGWRMYVDMNTGTLWVSWQPLPHWQPVAGCPELASPTPPQPPTAPPGTPPGIPPGCVPIPPGEVCPAPAEPPCPLPPKVPAPGPADEDIDSCKFIENIVHGIQAIQGDISGVVRSATGEGFGEGGISGLVARAIAGTGRNAVVPYIVNQFGKWLATVNAEFAKHLGCDIEAATPLAIYNGLVRFVQQWTSVVPKAVEARSEQALNYSCQYLFPSPADADNARLMGVIDAKQWECWHKIAGNIIDAQKLSLKAKRLKPDVLAVMSLWRREKLTDEERDKRLEALGVTDEAERKEYVTITEPLLQVQDLIRLMVRDVWNTKAVENGGLDEGFDKNYLDNKEAKKLVKAIGLTDEQMQLLWRAHFQLPSFTMLREMLFRLQPGDVDEKLAVSKKLMRETLIADDWAPGFVDRMIEIAYLPINRTDFKRLYLDHVIDDEQLSKHYEKVGYTPEDAKTLAEGDKVRRRINDYKTAGYPSLSVIAKAYGRCELDDSTLADAIDTLSISDEQRAAAFEAAELQRSVNERKVLIRSIQKEFRVGLIDAGEAASRLSEGGIDPGCIPSLVRGMTAQRAKQSKYLSATQLCKMRELGIITDGQQVEALIRAGWSTLDAQRIVAACMFQISEKQRKALEKAAREAAKAVEAERKRLAKEATASQ